MKPPKQVDSTTQWAGVLGDPISHSLSPALHRWAFQATHIRGFYVPLRVTAGELERLLGSLRDQPKLLGFNLTLPLKESALTLLDGIDEKSRLIGAVNTVVRRQGRWLGYNTDAPAFDQSLRAGLATSAPEQSALIFGAGGAARAAAIALALAGCPHLVICNRTSLRAQKLEREFSALFPKLNIETCAWRKGPVTTLLKKRRFLLVNATSGHRLSRRMIFPVDWRGVGPDHLLFDLNYDQAPLLEGPGRPFRSIDGLEMLVRQAAQSFSLWTGKTPDVAAMLRYGRRLLREPLP